MVGESVYQIQVTWANMREQSQC